MTKDPNIDVPLVRRLLKTQFPQWADLPVTPVPTQGMDNATFRLGERLSVRLPRYRRWVGQVEREQRWLPRLAPHLPLTVSTPLAQGDPGEGFGFPWSVYRWLDGDAVDPDRLDDPLRAARDLAEFILALQSIDTTGGPGPQWSNSYRGAAIDAPVDSVAAKERVLPKIEALKDTVDTTAIMEVWEAALSAPAWDRPGVWLHGDLAPGNLLSRDGRLSAVIDFGTVGVGDPACDVNCVWMFRDPPAREILRTELDVDEATWARARGWALAANLPVPGDPFFTDHPERRQRSLSILDDLVADFRQSA
ncbi:MAG: aminoglycoside phosphotransferase family protein [Stackebrandtia sp.]